MLDLKLNCAFIAFLCSYLILPCITDEHDCTSWICDNYKSTLDFEEYKNCTLSNPYWQQDEIFICTYCQITNNAVCWCASENRCRKTNALVIGISMMALSVLCCAIIWYKYIQKHKQIAMAKKILVQTEKQRKRREESSTKSRSIVYHTPKTYGTYNSDIDYDQMDDDTDIETVVTVRSAIKEDVIIIQNETDIHRYVGRYNTLCFCVWTVTVGCFIAFVLGIVVIVLGIA